MDSSQERTEIVFFDVETTIPFRKGQPYHLLEFGAILVCRQRLRELHNYSTLVRPADLSAITTSSIKCNGITREDVSTVPTFDAIAHEVYDILHGRVWAGHNIVRFDCVRIREAFAKIGLPAPEPKGIIDTLSLLTQRFGKRAGDMKMATLANYFGLGQQAHRSLEDVRMNLEVVRYCSSVLFLESSLPDILTDDKWVSQNITTRSQSNKKASRGERSLNTTTSALVLEDDLSVSPLNAHTEAEVPNHSMAKPDAFDMGALIDQIEAELEQPDAREEGTSGQDYVHLSATTVADEGCHGYTRFLDPDEVSVPSLSASLVPSYWGQTIQLLHKDVPLQLYCLKLRLRFGVSRKFTDSAGRPRISIVVDSPSGLCRILDVCDHLAQRLSVDHGSGSTWRPAVIRKNDFMNSSTIRLNIPYAPNGSHGSSYVYATDIYQKDASGSSERLVFNKSDANQLDSLFAPGSLVDAFLSPSFYDYQQSAGIRLVAKKLIVYS